MASSKEEAMVSSQPGTPKSAGEEAAKAMPAKKVCYNYDSYCTAAIAAVARLFMS